MKLTKSERGLLEAFFLLRKLPPPEMQRLLDGLEAEAFAKGETIYSARRFRRSLGILLEGRAVVRKEGGPILRELGCGDCFGAAALFAPGEEYVTTVEAQSACRIVFLSDRQLEDLFRRWPDLAMDYIAFLAGRVRFLNEKIDSFTRPSAEEALCLWLWQHRGADKTVEVAEGYSRLARELNMGRASLYRCLSELEGQGLLTKEGSVIAIQDPDGIRKRAGR